MGTNVKIPYRSFTVANGRFFFFDHAINTLVEKNNNGDILFTYPTIDVIGNEVISTAYDGVNFWTLQLGTVSTIFVVKAWQIDKFFCIKKTELFFENIDSSYDYNFTAMAVEHFSSTLTSGISVGDSSVYIDTHIDFEECSFYRLYIGPNSHGVYEDATVTGTLHDGLLGTDCSILNEFDSGTNVSLVNCLWLFNSYVETPDIGTLFRYDVVENNIDYLYQGYEIANISASTFYEEECVKYITFIKNNTLKFFDIEDKVVSKSLLTDNLSSDGSIIYPVKDIEIFGGTLYRLQNKFCYYGINYSYSTNNYQCSPMRSFIDSITLNIHPTIVPSDGMSTAELKAVVSDQYSDPSKFKTVYFSDNDYEFGYITMFEVLTGDDGTCLSYYQSGTSPKTVTITAFVTQFD